VAQLKNIWLSFEIHKFLSNIVIYLSVLWFFSIITIIMIWTNFINILQTVVAVSHLKEILIILRLRKRSSRLSN